MKNSELPRCPFEHITDQENIQIDEITDLTVKLLDKRYTKTGKPILRGVHPKSHGCVQATFKINDDIVEKLRVGLLANPGKSFKQFYDFPMLPPELHRISTSWAITAAGAWR